MITSNYVIFSYCEAKNRILSFVCVTHVHQFTSLDELEFIYEPVHEISNNVVCATSKGSDQPAHTRSLIRVFAHRLNIL